MTETPTTSEVLAAILSVADDLERPTPSEGNSRRQAAEQLRRIVAAVPETAKVAGEVRERIACLLLCHDNGAIDTLGGDEDFAGEAWEHLKAMPSDGAKREVASLYETADAILAALASTERQAGVPDGWRLVPEEPTAEMIKAGIFAAHFGKTDEEAMAGVLRSAIGAGPAAPQESGE